MAMKITKSQLKEIIKEEMEGRLDEIYWGPADPDHPEHQEFLKYQSQQPQPAAGLVKPPSLDDRVARLEEKLDELIRSLGQDERSTQVELEE